MAMDKPPFSAYQLAMEAQVTLLLETLEAAVSRSNDKPSWVDHRAKVGDQEFLVVDFEERGDFITLHLMPVVAD
jgi:hypothetical protein